MEWVLAIVASSIVLLLVAALVLVVGTLLLSGFIGHVLPGGSAVSRASFDCPFSKRRVTVEFLAAPSAEEPSDVLSCTAFPKPNHVRCAKECRGLAHAGWAPSFMVPRYALLSGGVAVRPLGGPSAPTPGGGPTGPVSRAA